MSYKIEKEGFEMYGFKLGQMTKQGRIIGFTKSGSDRIGVECESSIYKTHESVCMDYLLEGCKGVRFKWLEESNLIIEQPKISILAEIWNTTLILQTLHCEPFDSVEKNGIELRYNDSTIIPFNHTICLGCAEGNTNTDTYHFNTQAEAQTYLDTLLELVEMVNNPVPVVDLRVQAKLYELNGWSIYVNSRDVILQNSEEIEVIKWCKPFLKLETIKQQLEQIFTHLNVKAEVRI